MVKKGVIRKDLVSVSRIHSAAVCLAPPVGLIIGELSPVQARHQAVATKPALSLFGDDQ